MPLHKTYSVKKGDVCDIMDEMTVYFSIGDVWLQKQPSMRNNQCRRTHNSLSIG